MERAAEMVGVPHVDLDGLEAEPVGQQSSQRLLSTLDEYPLRVEAQHVHVNPPRHIHHVCTSHGVNQKSKAVHRLNEKSARETLTLRAGCRKAEPNIFHPAADPLPGGQDGQNLISWRWSPSPTGMVWYTRV